MPRKSFFLRVILIKRCPGADFGSAIRRHVHLTALIYPAILIWPIRLANVNQALKPLRYSLRLESTYTSASTPLMDTEHEPDLRLRISNRQRLGSGFFSGC